MNLGPPQSCPRAQAWLLCPSLDNRALSWVGEQAPSGGEGSWAPDQSRGWGIG